MYNKKFFNKHVLNALMSVLLAAGVLLAGCGAPDTGGAEAAAAAESDTSETSTEASEATEATEEATEAAPEEDLPALCYKTDEERWWQGKPGGWYGGAKNLKFHSAERNYGPSNKFFMVGGYITSPMKECDGDPIDEYVRLTGTLYEVFFYDSPEQDMVYFPGDELPEGYSVRTTENYELIFRDHNFRNDKGYDSKTAVNYSDRCFLEDDGTGVTKYLGDLGGSDIVRYDDFEEMEWAFNPGEYYEVSQEIDPIDLEKSVVLFRVLTKEDMERLPEGTKLHDDVMHY